MTSAERNFSIFETLPSCTRNSFMLYVQRCFSCNHSSFIALHFVGCLCFWIPSYLKFTRPVKVWLLQNVNEWWTTKINCLQNEQDDNFCTCMRDSEITCWWLSGFNFPSSFRSFRRSSIFYKWKSVQKFLSHEKHGYRHIHVLPLHFFMWKSSDKPTQQWF